MLQRVALGQVRFNLPGLTVDARGVVGGKQLAVRFAAIDRLVSFFRSLSAEQSLDDLQPGLRIAYARAVAGTREALVLLPAGSSHLAEVVARAARMAGGQCFTGTGKHFVQFRWLVVPLYLAGSLAILIGLGMQVGTELFPQVDSGQFVMRFRPPIGSNFELTREMAVKCLEEIEHEVKAENIDISMGFVGQVAPNFGIDNMVLFMRGPDDGQLRVAFREGSKIPLAEFRERMRKVLPERVVPWLAKRLEQGSFRWPAIGDGVMRLTASQLSALLDGLDWTRVRPVRVPAPRAVL